MNLPGTPALIGFGLYLGIIAVIATLAWRATRSRDDYLLGGRRLSGFTAAISAGASDMSAWLLLGLPGFAYLSGLESLWLATGLALGTWLNWHLIAPRLRRRSIALGHALTLPSFFQRQYPAQARALRVVSSGLILFFFLFYTASGLVAGGKLFNEVFGLGYHYAVLLGATLIVAYTMIGGFLAVSWTDVAQGLLMLLALAAVASLAGLELGTRPLAIDPNLLNPLTDNSGGALNLLAILSLLAWGLGYFGQPHILARFMAARDDKAISVARITGPAWAVLTMTAAILVGLAGSALQPGLADPERVFLALTETLLNPWIASIALAAILAAIMSTADSQLLVCAATLSEDLLPASAQHPIGTSRAAVLVITIIAVLIAWQPERGVLDLVAYAWAGLGAVFGPALLFSLFGDARDGRAIILGMLVGAVTTVVWHHLEGGLFDLYELAPAFLFASLAIVVSSHRHQNPSGA